MLSIGDGLLLCDEKEHEFESGLEMFSNLYDNRTDDVIYGVLLDAAV
jgi:hypothetical protein